MNLELSYTKSSICFKKLEEWKITKSCHGSKIIMILKLVKTKKT